MKKIQFKFAILLLVVGLTGCKSHSGFMSQSGQVNGSEGKGLVGTSVDKEGKESNVNITMTGGGEVGLASMDVNDKQKMSRALDAGTGKATHWENGATGVGYTVTPIRKMTVKGNPFCREYNVEATKGSVTKNSGGTACVTTDGSWHTM